MRQQVLFVLISVASCVCIWYLLHMCVHARACGQMCLASLMVGREDMELWHPHFC